MILHVVIGSEGEYSDRVEWVAGVFDDRKEAERLVTAQTEVGRARANERYEWASKLESLKKKAQEEKNKTITPEMRAYYAYPEERTRLTNDEINMLIQGLGPMPSNIGYDTYYIVDVPFNEWGRWED